MSPRSSMPEMPTDMKVSLPHLLTKTTIKHDCSLSALCYLCIPSLSSLCIESQATFNHCRTWTGFQYFTDPTFADFFCDFLATF